MGAFAIQFQPDERKLATGSLVDPTLRGEGWQGITNAERTFFNLGPGCVK